jgi:hypothetical protein
MSQTVSVPLADEPPPPLDPPLDPPVDGAVDGAVVVLVVGLDELPEFEPLLLHPATANAAAMPTAVRIRAFTRVLLEDHDGRARPGLGTDWFRPMARLA